jgi:phosphatidylglycerophosphate synthase
MLFEEPLLGLPIYEIGVFFLILAAGLTVWSMFGYIRAAWPDRPEGAPLS